MSVRSGVFLQISTTARTCHAHSYLLGLERTAHWVKEYSGEPAEAICSEDLERPTPPSRKTVT